MKLPKQFGGGGFQQALAKAQQAMARAKDLENELAAERITVDKGPVKCVFDGTGVMQSIATRMARVRFLTTLPPGLPEESGAGNSRLGSHGRAPEPAVGSRDVDRLPPIGVPPFTGLSPRISVPC